ncbi:MAG: S8 family serine peptidase [Dehalococcoidia bacterium]|nr:S8 family serine peptidase [Dehalococcoidia bacterium]
MRYAVIPKGLSLEQVETELIKVEARDIRRVKLLGQLFCELDEAQAERLSQVPGLKVRPVKEMKSAQIMAPESTSEQQAVVTQGSEIWGLFSEFRSLFFPSLSGTGLTVAVLDSGIRKTHNSLKGAVIYEADFSESGTVDDEFGHGTQVAFVIAGHDPHGETGVAPAAKLVSIKVLSDRGVGTEETVVNGIEEVCGLVEEAILEGIHPAADIFPNVINLSLGSEDDGDPDNPVRAACRQAIAIYGLDVISAVGNRGPDASTIMLPACDEDVIAVGALESDLFTIWEKSGRGPTLEGITKPDFVLWGTNLEMASHKNDDEYVIKSGTSFAAPMLTGLTGLLWEVGRHSYGEDWLFKWSQAKDFAPYYCAKPPDIPLVKDNAYGYGLPAIDIMVSHMIPTTVTAQEPVEMFPVLMLMGMVASIIGGIV